MRPRWVPLAWSAASGVLAALAYPGYGLDPLVWVAWIPLLGALERRTLGARLGLGWLGGTVYFSLILTWLWTLWDWAGPFIVLGYLALSALMGASWGLWAWALGWLAQDRPWRALLVGPACWVVLEYLRGSGPLGFTWGTPALALHGRLLPLQWAAWTGPWGLSAGILFVNVSLFLALRRRWRFAVLALAALALIWTAGALRLRQVERVRAPTLEVALIQPNIPQREKTDPSRLEALWARYRQLLARVPAAAGLVVLPESILPTFVLEDEPILSFLQGWSAQRRVPLLWGTFAREDGKIYNAAALLEADGTLAGRYDKVQLVPFSTEYFPFLEQLRALGLGRLLAGLPLGSLTPGRTFAPLQAGELTLGTPICFETAFPGIGRAFARQGVDLLLAITNDAWFKRSRALAQHAAFGALRAVESGRSFVQVANTGLSVAFSATGRRLIRLPAHEAQVATVAVPLVRLETLYVRGGVWFVLLSFLLVLACGAVRLGRRPDR